MCYNWLHKTKQLPIRIGLSATDALKSESRVIVDQTSYGEDICLFTEFWFIVHKSLVTFREMLESEVNLAIKGA